MSLNHRWSLSFIIEILTLLGYMTIIYILSSSPLPAFVHLPIDHIDKFYHTTAFFILGILAAQVGFRSTNSFFWGALIGAFLASTYGLSDEWHQAFVVGRFSSMSDIFADYVGAFSGAILWSLRQKKRGVSFDENSLFHL